MLRSVRPSVSLSVPFYNSVPFATWRYERVTVSNAFDRGQHGAWAMPASKCYQGVGACRFAARYLVVLYGLQFSRY